MGNNIKDKFIDTMDTINKLAKLHKWLNGLEWAKFAKQFSLITEKQFIEYDKLHNLRNAMSHGNSKNITVSTDSYSFAKIFLSICEKKIRDNKFQNGKVQSNKKEIQNNKFTNSKTNIKPNKPSQKVHKQIIKKFVITNIEGTYFKKYVSGYILGFHDNFTESIQKAMHFNNRSEANRCLDILRGKYEGLSDYKGTWNKLIDDLWIKEVVIN